MRAAYVSPPSPTHPTPPHPTPTPQLPGLTLGDPVVFGTTFGDGDAPEGRTLVIPLLASKAKERLREGTLEGRNSHFAATSLSAGLGAAASSHEPMPAAQPAVTGYEPSCLAAAPSVATGPPAKRPRTQAEDSIFPAMPTLKLLARDACRPLLDFELKGILGKGTFGSVFEAQIGPNKKIVAIKVFQGAECRINALRQALALERCAHPQVISLLDAWFDGQHKRSFLVFPKCASDLEHHIRAVPGTFTVHTCRDLLESLCKGVAWIHVQGLLHTDLKPGNVLLGSVAPVGNFYVADLGCCVEAMCPSVCKLPRQRTVRRVPVHQRATLCSRKPRLTHRLKFVTRRNGGSHHCFARCVPRAECFVTPPFTDACP